ncbi:MAG: hypothetical protein AAGA34_06080 [Pseudomonadota bacterium]
MENTCTWNEVFSLHGGNGDDTLIGGIGRDRLLGGDGEETVALGVDDTPGADGNPDLIADFMLGDDILDTREVLEDFDALR